MTVRVTINGEQQLAEPLDVGGMSTAYRALSTVKAATFDPALITTSNGLGDDDVNWQAIYLPYDAVITGVAFFQVVQGDYTADQSNQVGLYTSDGTTLTRVAQSTSDGNLWKGTANTLVQKAFSSPYSASAGLYFVATLYNNSAQTTLPQIGSRTALSNSAISQVLMRNSDVKWSGSLTGQNSLPATQAWSGVAAATTSRWLALY